MHTESTHTIALACPDPTSFPFPIQDTDLRMDCQKGMGVLDTGSSHIGVLIACSTKRRVRLNRKT